MKSKLWLVQMESKLYDKKANAEKIFNYLDKAAKAEVGLVVFPELALTGYEIHEKSGELAETIPGPSTEQIMEKARKEGVYVVLGMPELSNGYVYNSAPMFGPEGLVGIWRKLYPATVWLPVYVFDEEMFFKPGSDIVTFDTQLGKIGVIICRDLLFAEPARGHGLRGALLVVCIMGVPLVVDPTMKLARAFGIVRALENAVWVCAVNVVGRQGAIDFAGGSFIVNSSGQLAKTASVGKNASEQILELELDTEALLRARIRQVRASNNSDVRPSILRQLADIAERC